MIQTALLQVAEATQAAVRVAKAAQASATASSAQSGAAASGGAAIGSKTAHVDWSKLLNRPCNFDNKFAEEDIKGFKDWHWQLSQYLTAVDEGFALELKQINDDPGKALDLESASAETRQSKGLQNFTVCWLHWCATERLALCVQRTVQMAMKVSKS